MNQKSELLCFQSELAAQILENPAFFTDSIYKVSQAILTLLSHSENRAFLSGNTILSDDIILQLYSNSHFGIIGPEISYCPSQEQFLAEFAKILEGTQKNLPQILHIHQIFMQNIFDKLPFKSQDSNWKTVKEELVTVLFRNELFVNARKKINASAGELTTKVGISGDISCPKNSLSNTQPHKNILGMFASNPDSYWGKHIENNQLPFVAGPSGHTGSAILLAIIVGDLKDGDLKTYLSATMGILIGGGYHTADEVMSVTNRTGLPYEPGKYWHLLPEEFLCSEPARELSAKYPELLPAYHCKPDSWQPVGESMGHGFIRGLSNTFEQYSLHKGFSPKMAATLHAVLYYGSLFGMKYMENYLVEKSGDCWNTLYKSAMDTANIALINTVFKMAESVLQKFKIPYQDKICSLFSFGMFTWTACASEHPPATMIGATLAGTGTQLATEAVGKMAFLP